MARLASGALHCGSQDVPERHKARGWSLSQEGTWLVQPEAISPECSSPGHSRLDTQWGDTKRPSTGWDGQAHGQRMRHSKLASA